MNDHIRYPPLNDHSAPWVPPCRANAGFAPTYGYLANFAGARRPPVKGGAAMDASFSQMAAEIKLRFNRIDSAVEDHMARVKDLKREYEALGRTNVTGADKSV